MLARHFAIDRQLALAEIQNRHIGSGRRQDRPLVPSAGGQSQDLFTADVADPWWRYGFGRGQPDGKITPSGGINLAGISRREPAVTAGRNFVPCISVESVGIQ